MHQIIMFDASNSMYSVRTLRELISIATLLTSFCESQNMANKSNNIYLLLKKYIGIFTPIIGPVSELFAKKYNTILL